MVSKGFYFLDGLRLLTGIMNVQALLMMRPNRVTFRLTLSV